MICRHLLEFLEEKRLAVITQAVTKGLDPSAPMVESGNKWLGEVPAHWDVKRLKLTNTKVTVGIVVTPAKYYADEGIPALRSFNIKERRLDLTDLAFISEEANKLHAKSMIFEGDLIAVRTGQPGTTAVVPVNLNGANCVDLIIIRRPGPLLSEYLAYYANCYAAKAQYQLGAQGALQQHFNIDTAKNLVVIVPPREEQQQIVDRLTQEEGRLHRMSESIEKTVATLRDYRSSLITDAVTGKIDVSNSASRTRGLALTTRKSLR